MPSQSRPLDAAVWGPHFWFVMHTMAYTYPVSNPTPTTKRQMYDFFHRLPLFLPDAAMGGKFQDLLNAYPLTPFLDKRESLMRWVHQIHNRINRTLGKPRIEYQESLDKYRQIYHTHQWSTKYQHYGNVYSALETKTIVYCAIVGVFLLVLAQSLKNDK